MMETQKAPLRGARQGCGNRGAGYARAGPCDPLWEPIRLVDPRGIHGRAVPPRTRRITPEYWRNSEGYWDPTAGEALERIEREERRRQLAERQAKRAAKARQDALAARRGEAGREAAHGQASAV